MHYILLMYKYESMCVIYIYIYNIWEGNLQSITVSSAYCLVRLASCPLHSA